MKKTVSIVLSILMLLSVLSLNSFAENTDYEFEVTYQQTEARKVIDMVNEVRTSGTSWYWNEDDSAKINTGKLNALTYDYELEKIAMKRAAEIVISYSHTRPNGTSCFTAFSSGYWSKGENIAKASFYWEADSVFEAWMEEDEPYSGQGHRRNILNSDFTAIGMAMCTYNGYSFWVMELGYPVQNATKTTANDSKTTVTVSTAEEYVEEMEKYHNPFTDDIQVTNTVQTYTGKAILPTVKIITENGKTLVQDVDYTYTGCCEGGCINAGHHTVCITVSGSGGCVIQYTTCFWIESQPLTSSRVTISATSYKYTGKTVKPTVTVKNKSGTKLNNGTDYKVSYCCSGGCKQAGTHTVTVTGNGNYSNTVSKTFTIGKQAISSSKVTISATSFKYTGKTVKPTVTVKNAAGTVLKSGTDYKVSYCCSGGCKKAGTHTVTVTGIGNYSTSVKKTFKITKQALVSSKVTVSATAQYTGKAVKPKVTVKNAAGTVLKSGTDYKVSYCCSGGCKKVGTHTVTVTGIGNYSTSVKKTFKITKQTLVSSKVTVSATVKYTGKTVKPKITVKNAAGTVLKSGTDYKITYCHSKGCKTKGTHKVTITGIGNYTGKITKSFKIK